MYYVYVLQSKKDNKFYIGSTGNLRKRFVDHQNGNVKSTRNRLPFEILCYEAYQNKKISQVREKYLKSSNGHKDLYKRFLG